MVDSVDDCAAAIVDICRDRRRAAQLGSAGREPVRRRFLLPRMIRDDARLYAELLDA
ncbi:MAG: hypothetical protein HZB46_12905 [Solirubrobacterales bacterium]|nr:hypothetical protein [Solirubrobacterales bacterium]